MGLLYDKQRAKGGRMFRSTGEGGESEGFGYDGGYDGGDVADAAPAAPEPEPAPAAPAPAVVEAVATVIETTIAAAVNVVAQVLEAITGAASLGPVQNAQLSLSEQYAEYGAGRVAAEKAGGYGVAAAGYSANSGTPAQQAAFLSGATNLTPAEQIDAAKPGIVASAVNVVLGLLGIASGTPTGVIGGGKAAVGGFAGLSAALSNPDAGRESDLGFSGNLGESFAGSAAPSLYDSSATGAIEAAAGFAGVSGQEGDVSTVSGAPVLGFGGVQVNAPQTTGGGAVAGSTLGAALAALLGQGPRGRYAAPGAGAQSSPAIAPALLVAGLASIIFMG